MLGWTANRNVLVAATLAFAALLVHDRARRDGWRPGTWLAPALFAAALLGGEAALAVTGYLFAHALFIDAGPLARRLARLWPYAVLSVAWLVAYKALGYGTSGGSMYLNPLDEPAGYLRALVERLPVLLAAQLGLSLSDAWLVLPPSARVVAYGLALLWLAVFGVVLAPVWRRVPACRFWALGAVLSLPPVCATFPMDRLLVFAGVGAMAAVALVLAEWLDGRRVRAPPAAAPRRSRRASSLLLVLLHLVLAPLLLPLRVLLLGWASAMGRTLEASIPADESVGTKTLVILSSAAEMTTFPPWMERQVRGVPRPRRMRVLATCFGDAARLAPRRDDAARPAGEGLPRQRAPAHGARPLAAVPRRRRGRALRRARAGERGHRGRPARRGRLHVRRPARGRVAAVEAHPGRRHARALVAARRGREPGAAVGGPAARAYARCVSVIPCSEALSRES